MRGIMSVFVATALGLALVCNTCGSTARAAEFKLLCAVALHPAIDELVPDFEKSSGHKVHAYAFNSGDRSRSSDASTRCVARRAGCDFLCNSLNLFTRRIFCRN